ncbi:hypothetical protein COOONC_06851 [Cooperia oncophora]
MIECLDDWTDALIHKLKELKFHPILINWITDFLREAYSGVPQGGVLSPVLFNIFTAEIPSLFRGLGVSVKMYADDVTIYKRICGQPDCEELQSY